MSTSPTRETSDRTATFFDRYAHDFSAIYGNKNTIINTVINKLFRESMKLRFFMTLEGCNPVEGKSVLDVGCGPGHYGAALARRGAGKVLGIDFAEGMLEIARQNARQAGVADKCEYRIGDFTKETFKKEFDYVILMGFMDYMADPKAVVANAIGACRSRAFFSFPLDGGVLGFQRKLRYKSRCDLYMYTEEQVRGFFAGLPVRRVDIETIDRDLFVTAHVE
jgi:2-polyprenyl-3-methyl-5-hydroxy-6-metoxy-1,4-benzoquinol methylase